MSGTRLRREGHVVIHAVLFVLFTALCLIAHWRTVTVSSHSKSRIVA